MSPDVARTPTPFLSSIIHHYLYSLGRETCCWLHMSVDQVLRAAATTCAELAANGQRQGRAEDSIWQWNRTLLLLLLDRTRTSRPAQQREDSPQPDLVASDMCWQTS